MECLFRPRDIRRRWRPPTWWERRGRGDRGNERGAVVSNAREVLGLGGPQIDRRRRGEVLGRNQGHQRGHGGHGLRSAAGDKHQGPKLKPR